MRVRISGERTGYRIDARGHQMPVVVPAGSIGDAGPVGRDEHADCRNVIVVLDGRDVIVPDLRPGQYAVLPD